MKEILMENLSTDQVLIERLKAKCGLENKRQVAAHLGLSEAFIGRVVNGKDAIGPVTKLLILSELGYQPAIDAVRLLTPEGLEEAFQSLGI